MVMHDGNLMLSTVEQHYERHLAPVYQWMAGGWEMGLARGESDLSGVLPADLSGRTAVDLGAGIGMHSVPLAGRGCRVLAVDTSAQLLRTLRLHGKGLPIRTVQADMRSLQSLVKAPADIILCMGDTITHLPDLPSIEALLRQIAALLAREGVFVTTFRDYTVEPSGSKRFIPVGSDANRILTCFLEYTQERVNVHDLLHERDGEAWKLSVSGYEKVRVSPAWVREVLSACGLCTVMEAGGGGMARVVARRA